MELQHVNVKIPVDGESPVDPEKFIEVFHRWIREHTLAGLLIDVADYRHVPNGPGVMLIGGDYDVSFDNTGGDWGLLYNRKTALDGSNQDRFSDAFKSAVAACKLLEAEFSSDGLKFNRQQFELIINDRALAPNTDETWEAARPEFESFVKSTCSSDEFEIDCDTDPRRRVAVQVRTSVPIDFDSL